jgi:hypothetical protein
MLMRWGAIMRVVGAVFAAAVICCVSAPSWAIEGSTAAGPIGGTDIRSSLPLRPGLYGGGVVLAAFAHQFNDGNGDVIPALSGLDLSRGRLFWTNYLPNPATQYTMGTLLNVDFAVTEHIGRVQLGLAGFYTAQIADDRQFGVPLLPDGRRTRVLDLGGVLAYDLPEYASSMKIKALRTVISDNNVNAWGVAVARIRKFH